VHATDRLEQPLLLGTGAGTFEFSIAPDGDIGNIPGDLYEGGVWGKEESPP
jgi:hypothetical protein